MRDALRQRRLQYERLSRRRQIQLRGLREALASVPPERRAVLERTIRVLIESGIEDGSLDRLYDPAPIPGDDVMSSYVAKTSNVSILLWLCAFMLVAIVFVYISNRRRSQNG